MPDTLHADRAGRHATAAAAVHPTHLHDANQVARRSGQQERAWVAVKLAADVGAVMMTTGAVVSGAIVQTNVRDADSVPSDTVAVTLIRTGGGRNTCDRAEWMPSATTRAACRSPSTDSGSLFASVPTSCSDAASPMFAVWFAIAASTGATLNVTVSTSVETLPAASRAVTVTLLRPLCSAIAPVFQVVVPAAIPLPPRSFAQVTCVTPTRVARGTTHGHRGRGRRERRGGGRAGDAHDRRRRID